MNIRSITIVQGTGPDRVSLETDFPSPCPGFDSHELCLDFNAAADAGPAYVAQHFPGIPVRLVPRPGNNYRFSRPREYDPVTGRMVNKPEITRRLRA